MNATASVGGESTATLSDRLLQVARWAVAALALFAAAGLVAGIWLFPSYAATHFADFMLTPAWSADTTRAAVAQLGWSPLAIPWYQFSRDVINFLLCASLGVILLLRGPRTWFGLFVALTFIAMAYANSYLRAVAAVVPPAGTLTNTVARFAWQLLFILFFVFPDGRFVPRWTRWLVILWLVINLPVVSSFLDTRVGWWAPMPLVFIAIGSQVYRYFWHSGPVQRAQTKWVVYPLACLMPLGLAYGIFVPITVDQAVATDRAASALMAAVVWQTVGWVAGMVLTVGFAIAILRYRLWDIDVIIRRTIVYAGVSALLGLVFYGTVILLQRLFTGVTGQTSAVALVVSTLVIAALFSPLRRRIHDIVDRRFYRRKYDAQQVLADFATVARDETNLDRLATGLSSAVANTMQPAQVGVWLAPGGKGGAT